MTTRASNRPTSPMVKTNQSGRASRPRSRSAVKPTMASSKSAPMTSRASRTTTATTSRRMSVGEQLTASAGCCSSVVSVIRSVALAEALAHPVVGRLGGSLQLVGGLLDVAVDGVDVLFRQVVVAVRHVVAEIREVLLDRIDVL